METCCELGAKLNLKKNVLYETDNFFVAPSIGQMGIEGYLLLCSKKHYIGIGDVPKESEFELEEVLSKVKKVLSKTYNLPILVFEHGPKLGCSRGGGCLDHAHLHLIPISINILDFLKEFFELEKVHGFGRLREIYENAKYSYLFINTGNDERYVIKIDFPLPSQYLRQVIAAKFGIKDWDWRINPDYQTFNKTIKTLQGSFE